MGIPSTTIQTFHLHWLVFSGLVHEGVIVSSTPYCFPAFSLIQCICAVSHEEYVPSMQYRVISAFQAGVAHHSEFCFQSSKQIHLDYRFHLKLLDFLYNSQFI